VESSVDSVTAPISTFIYISFHKWVGVSLGLLALLGAVVLLPNRLHKDFQRLNLALREKTKLGAEEHEVLETCVEVWRHAKCLECSEERRVDDAVSPE